MTWRDAPPDQILADIQTAMEEIPCRPDPNTLAVPFVTYAQLRYGVDVRPPRVKFPRDPIADAQAALRRVLAWGRHDPLR